MLLEELLEAVELSALRKYFPLIKKFTKKHWDSWFGNKQRIVIPFTKIIKLGSYPVPYYGEWQTNQWNNAPDGTLVQKVLYNLYYLTSYGLGRD